MARSVLWLASAAAALAFGLPAAAQPAPSTPDARDLGGVWSNASLTPLVRARGVAKLEVTPAEAAQMVNKTAVAGIDPGEKFQGQTYSDPKAGAPAKGGQDFGIKGYDGGWVAPGTTLARVRGQFRTSDIIEPADGQLPYRDKAGAMAKAALRGHKYAFGDDPYIGPESTTLSERCLIGFGGTGGPGMLSVLYNNTYQFVQTKDHLLIVVEMVHDTRDIPIFANAEVAKASHGPAVLARWLGDSVGWWEGNTLVVETTNVNPKQGAEGPFALSPSAKVTERFTRVGPKEINYAFTVDDPATYTQPWKAELSFYPQTALYEYACHEGNYGLKGILEGARLREKQAAANGGAARAATGGGD